MTTVSPGGALRYAGAARPLPVNTIAKAADSLGADPACLTAVMVVETGLRSGFLPAPDNRPRILYEAHIAFRLCGRPLPGLSVERWDRTLYAPTSAGEWGRLSRAIEALGEDTALQAASWGVGQVLGSNHALCGFATVQGMARSMAEGEDQQLGAMLAYIRGRKLVDALRRISADPATCATFASGYNGTAYRANAYHEKLAAAFRRAKLGKEDGVLSTGDYGPEVAALQRALVAVGIRVGTDGDFGRMTRIAVEQVQAARKLPATGVVDATTAAALGLA